MPLRGQEMEKYLKRPEKIPHVLVTEDEADLFN